MKWRVCFYNKDGEQLDIIEAITLIKAIDVMYVIANDRGDVYGITMDYVEDK